MTRIALLILCLLCVADASVYSSEGAPPRKRHTLSDFFSPYFEISGGAMSSNSKNQTASVINYYHDREKDEMVYDEDLHYNIINFDGWTYNVGFRAGAYLFRFWGVFLDNDLFLAKGDYRYKYYSRDKEDFLEHDSRLRYYLGFGSVFFPFNLFFDSTSKYSFLNGTFAGFSLGPTYLYGQDKAEKKYGMDYEDWEMTFRFEVGYLWEFTEHFFVGVAFKTVLSFNNEEGDEYKGGNMPTDDVPLNTKSFGFVIKVVRK